MLVTRRRDWDPTIDTNTIPSEQYSIYNPTEYSRTCSDYLDLDMDTLCILPFGNSCRHLVASAAVYACTDMVKYTHKIRPYSTAGKKVIIGELG